MSCTNLIIALNVLVYAAMLAIVGAGELAHFSSETLLRFGALYTPLVRDGDWFRVVTAIFLHITPVHLLMNMVALYQVGTVLEPHYGRVRFVLLYLAAGLGGSAASILWHLHRPAASAGASGAISGLIAAGAVAGHLIGGEAGRRYRDAMLRWAAIILVFGLVAHVDNAAHGGGFVLGGAVAWLLDRGGRALRRRPGSSAMGWEVALLVAVVGLGFGLAGRARDQAQLVEQVVNGGVEHAKAGRFDQAIAAYRRALHMSPKDEIAQFDLALALFRKGALPEATAAAREATELAPRNKEAWALLAQTLELSGRHEEAARAYGRYLELGGPPLGEASAAEPAADGEGSPR